MEKWRYTFEYGFAPNMTNRELECLLKALNEYDPRLIQGATTKPPPLVCVQDWPCEAGCAIVLAGWLGSDRHTVGDVESRFAELCFYADQNVGEPAYCRHFLRWFDDTPIDEVRPQLSEVIESILESRCKPDPQTEVQADAAVAAYDAGLTPTHEATTDEF